ncbi:Dynamin [Penicillium bovifimosum]|uniref:Dynamin n=1 Tax=Penicillium bovifimosum TaxID=126998 RepID=A0A9W9HB66_9EURO|nr:Dynamin [Penicillium bovifimosum]KAJ5143353.1 Dynamin [Penicillium bovifimosum]
MQPISLDEEEGGSSGGDRGKDNPGLNSVKTSQRLNQIDCVRANGVGDHIALPQLAVCGDQSAGKSSVLEGITGYPFPRKDGLCTQFPTEIVLRHDTEVSSMTASLLPSASRSPEEKEKFAAFHREFRDFNELPTIIREASFMMGVRGFNEFADAPGFAADVLRLELVGNTGLHLTLVDLPGLISVAEDDEDVEIVQGLVDSYLESSRTIILAVIPASSDAETQRIIQRARHFDKEGVRTVGIITKPDLINKNTEERVARLAKNLDRTKLNLGFFLVKNPSPDELVAGSTLEGPRNRPTRIGIANLRSFLEDLLDSHIERELPKVQQEVRRLLQLVDEEIDNLGIERSNAGQVRLFLTHISTEFHAIIKNGLEGNYDGRDGDFFADSSPGTCRLRAVIHRENERFADYMRNHGQRRKIVTAHGDGEDMDDSTEEIVKDQNEELLVTQEEMFSWIREMYHESRGRELPGNYNHSLLQRLFHIQSCRWNEIARRHIESVVKMVTQFVHRALNFVVKDAGVARHDEAKASIQASVKRAAESDWGGSVHFSNSPYEMDRMISSLQKRVEVNMVERACSEVLTDLNAYYKVAMKTFVDNVCRQVIERHILAKLGGAFHPTVVSSFSDEELIRLAGESLQTTRRRTEKLQLKRSLEASLQELSI